MDTAVKRAAAEADDRSGGICVDARPGSRGLPRERLRPRPLRSRLLFLVRGLLLLLRGLLLLFSFLRAMLAHGAPGGGAQQAMVSGKVAGNTAHGGALG